ncbi:MAG: PTS sugar transporter subunit IIC [Brevinema sp.]
MFKIFERVTDILSQKMSGLLNNHYINVLKDGIIVNLIPSLIGSFFLLIVVLPIPGYSEFMANFLGQEWSKYPLLIVGVSLDMMGIIAAIAISYRLAESYKISALQAAITSFMCYLLMTPFFVTYHTEIIAGVIPTIHLGSRGLFTAILVAFISTEIYTFLIRKKIVISMPEGVPPAVSRSFESVIPALVTLIIFMFFRILVDISPYDNINTMIVETIIAPLSFVGASFWGLLLYVFLLHFLWFFGIHGALVVGTLYAPLFTVLADQNRLAFQAGEVLPNLLTAGNLETYVFLGGSGSSLSIVLPLIFIAKSQLFKQVSRLSIAPGIFNINEPFIFSIPVVMNPRVAIPWILAPIVNLIITYIATTSGFVPPHPGIVIPWTTPIIISGFLIGGISGVILQIVNLCCSGLIWYIFIYGMDKEQYKLETK